MKKLGSKQRILFEQYFSYKNMSVEEGDKYLNILLNSNIFSTCFCLYNNIETELVFMSLKKEEDKKINFNGAYALVNKNNETLENRTIDGIMTVSPDIAVLEAEIERLCIKTIYNETFTFNVLDVMRFYENKEFSATSKVGFDLNIETIKKLKQELTDDNFDKLVLKKTYKK